MNYPSQLRGWAIDRSIEIAKVNGDKLAMAQIRLLADDLIAYAYVADKDFSDSMANISAILKSSPDALAKVQQLQAELGMIEEDIMRQSAMQKAGNGTATETRQ